MSKELFEVDGICKHNNHDFGPWGIKPYWENCGPNDFDDEVCYIKNFRICRKCGYESYTLQKVSGYEEQRIRMEIFEHKQEIKKLEKELKKYTK